MAKQYNIKWREQDILNLRKTVRNYNAKITRLSKKYPELIDFLPERISVAGLRESIKTRNDYNKTVNKYKRFMKKGAETPITGASGAKTTKWELAEVNREIAIINKRRKSELAKLDISPYKGNMGSVERNSLTAKKNRFNVLPDKEWNKFVKRVEAESKSDYPHQKAEQYKLNYINTCLQYMGIYANGVISIVRKIPAEEFYQISVSNYDILSINFFYTEAEAYEKANEIIGRLEALGYN